MGACSHGEETSHLCPPPHSPQQQPAEVTWAEAGISGSPHRHEPLLPCQLLHPQLLMYFKVRRETQRPKPCVVGQPGLWGNRKVKRISRTVTGGKKRGKKEAFKLFNYLHPERFSTGKVTVKWAQWKPWGKKCRFKTSGWKLTFLEHLTKPNFLLSAGDIIWLYSQNYTMRYVLLVLLNKFGYWRHKKLFAYSCSVTTQCSNSHLTPKFMPFHQTGLPAGIRGGIPRIWRVPLRTWF